MPLLNTVAAGAGPFPEAPGAHGEANARGTSECILQAAKHKGTSSETGAHGARNLRGHPRSKGTPSEKPRRCPATLSLARLLLDDAQVADRADHTFGPGDQRLHLVSVDDFVQLQHVRRAVQL
eukprot:4786578-Pyramimonas_sp.AAC.1